MFLWCAQNHCFHHDMETEGTTVCGTDGTYPHISRIGIYLSGKTKQGDVSSVERQERHFFILSPSITFLGSTDHLHFLRCCDNTFLFTFLKEIPSLS